QKTQKISFLQASALPSPNIVLNREKTQGVYAKDGDIFILDPKTYASTPITRTTDRESNPQFSHNGTRIAYTKGGELYTWEIATGITEQMTRFVKAKGKEAKRDSRDEWLYQDQLGLFEVLQERKAKQDAGKKIADQLDGLRPLELETGSKSVMGLQIDPSGRYISYLLVERPKTKGTAIPHFVTESGYTEDQGTRSKVGDEPTQYELFIYDVQRRKNYAVVLDKLEGLDYIPEYTQDYPQLEYSNRDRTGFINGPTWNPQGTQAILEIQANDYKDRWIA